MSAMSTIAQVFVAFGTISVAILAIWGDFFRQLLAGPRLELELNDPKGDLNKRDNGVRTHYYHLAVKNGRKWSPARFTRILVVKIEKQRADGTFFSMTQAAPLQLRWYAPQFHELFPTIGTDDVCDLGHLDEGAERFELEPYVKPNNFAGHVAAGETMRVSIIASAHNHESKDPLVLEISWDGNWSPEPSEMERHLVIKKI